MARGASYICWHLLKLYGGVNPSLALADGPTPASTIKTINLHIFVFLFEFGQFVWQR
jgi:hypothetical protein